MNQKLKDIFTTAWTEPRHFFFWLAVLTFMGLGVLVLAINWGLRMEGGRWLLLAVVLACCFVASLLVFLLALIPAGRRTLSFLLQHRFLTLAALLTLIALFYAIENWRGHRAWQTYKQTGEARGQRFELASIVPPPVPDDQNFFETPLWNDMHFRIDTNGGQSPHIVWQTTNWGIRAFFDVYGPRSGSSPKLGNWRAGEKLDLTAWQAFYRGSNNVFVAADGSSTTTNFFPVAANPQTAADDVLLALSRYDPDRRILIESAARPHARFWINYEEGVSALLPHLARFKGCGQYLCLHADAARESGATQVAVQDVKLSFRLLESVRGEPLVISHLVRIAVLYTTIQPIWDGIADWDWTEAELRTFEEELRKLDFCRDYFTALEGERAFNVWSVDYVREQPGQRIQDMMSMMERTSEPAGVNLAVLSAVAELAPRGWFEQNKVTLNRILDTHALPIVDATNCTFSPQRAEEAWIAVQKTPLSPYTALARFLAPLHKVARQFAKGQCMVDLARAGCAIERYRLANGRLPENLQALVPQFLDRPPKDLITGAPLNYRRDSNDGFLVYSVGWDKTDDGGKLANPDKAEWTESPGDWVWRVPAQQKRHQ